MPNYRSRFAGFVVGGGVSVGVTALGVAGVALPAQAQAQEDVTCTRQDTSVQVALNGTTHQWFDKDTNNYVTLNQLPSGLFYDTYGYETLGGARVTLPADTMSRGSVAGTFTDGRYFLDIAEVYTQTCGTIEAGSLNLPPRWDVANMRSALQGQLGGTFSTTFGILPFDVFGPATASQATVSRSGNQVTVELPPTSESSAWHWSRGSFSFGLFRTGNPSLQNTEAMNGAVRSGYLLAVLTDSGEFVPVPMTRSGNTLSGLLPSNAESFMVVALDFNNAQGQPGHGWLQALNNISGPGVQGVRYTRGPWVDPTVEEGFAFELR